MSTRDLMRRIGRGGGAGGQWAQCIGGGQARCEEEDEERRGNCNAMENEKEKSE